ncbi:thermonuclease family protein [Cohaesibacter celericrescens]|uniref:Nuclease n=1 Tax=Cohaesibacter celericrescens TaxID=2067669 RepID=A0A2N5XQV8_9HYPH|nr:thermonuclease family protein [Cohaesibacter celericrescens]PLW76827.1 nuclease [Cohaesibacter celericrescens]
MKYHAGTVSFLAITAVAVWFFTGPMPICSFGSRYSCVVDGDTFWLEGTKYRLKGVDTPEMKGKCSNERRLAERASEALSAHLGQGELKLQTFGEDRFGRTLVKISSDGQDAGQMLLDKKLARQWPDGQKFWCDN